MRNDRNENGERRIQFNVFDIILTVMFVALVGVIIAIVIQALPETPQANNDKELTYVVTVTNVPEKVAAQLSEKQVVYDVSTGKSIGTVTKVKSTGYIIKGVDQETGELIGNPVPGQCNIEITISASAKQVDNGYQVNGIALACGSEYRIRTSTVYLDCVCVSI